MALIVAFVVAVIATPAAAWLATRLGLVDHPGPLKVHARPVPYLGGLAVLLALAGPVARARPSMLVPLVLAALLGVADDATDLSPVLRIVVEIGIGLAVAWVMAPHAVGLPRPERGGRARAGERGEPARRARRARGRCGRSRCVRLLRRVLRFERHPRGRAIRRARRVPRVECAAGARVSRRRGELSTRYRARNVVRRRRATSGRGGERGFPVRRCARGRHRGRDRAANARRVRRSCVAIAGTYTTNSSTGAGR